MLGEKHDLLHELPEYKERIHELKISNHHFAKLFRVRSKTQKPIIQITLRH